MSFPHPTPEEQDQLELACSECKAPVDSWCIGQDGKIRSMLHTARRLASEKGLDQKRKLSDAEMRKMLGDRPEGRGARVTPGAVLDVACRMCGQPAVYEVRNADHWEGACPLHLFSMIAAYLTSSNVVAVSMINKNAKYEDRRAAIEQAVSS